MLRVVDSIWSRVKQDSQYQQEGVQDWAFHLEHLQAILIEFDADGAPEKSDLIRSFREGPKPSIKAQMEQRGRELDSWDELVEKAINAEAKTSLQPSPILRSALPTGQPTRSYHRGQVTGHYYDAGP